MIHPVNFYYRFDRFTDGEELSAPVAVVRAKDRMLADWRCHHWHLDSVSVNQDTIGISFTGIPAGNWEQL